MAHTAFKNHSPWHNRWATPSLEQLIEPLKFHQKRTFNLLLNRLDSFEQSQRTILWYGPSWKWSIHYFLPPKALAAARAAHNGDKPKNGKTNGTAGPNGHVNGTKKGFSVAPGAHAALSDPGHLPPGAQPGGEGSLLYLVPNTENAIMCVPLSDEQIEVLPKKRMSRFIRDGITASKCAVQTHWAIWSPTSEADVTLLVELAKRKLDFLLGQSYKPVDHD